MPRVIANTQDSAATLEETVEAVAQGFDPQDETSLLDAAASLERLRSCGRGIAIRKQRLLTARR